MYSHGKVSGNLIQNSISVGITVLSRNKSLNKKVGQGKKPFGCKPMRFTKCLTVRSDLHNACAMWLLLN